MSTADFYRAFEERHRGARSLIAQRLEVYQPFIAPLAQLYSPAAAIDLGCGRGEWLELLIREGFTAQGVDLDEGMLAACRERELPAMYGNAVGHLKTLADASQCVVSGFHFAEHIAFDDLETLVSESLRVLKPGGLLILETPNPENLVVGTSGFYLDPTHVRPLPPLLLSFLPEYHGFRRVKILRLQEAPSLRDAFIKIGLMQVLEGVSPDYSIIAQKAAAPDVLDCFDAAFATAHGVELEQLARRHDATVEHQLSAFAQRLAAGEARAGETSAALARTVELQSTFERRIATAEAHAAGMSAAIACIAELQDRLIEAAAAAARSDALIAQLRAQGEEAGGKAMAAANDAQQLRQRIDALDLERNALRASWSWRVTAPLRWGAGLAADSRPSLPASAKKAVDFAAGPLQRPLVGAMSKVLRDPALAYRINQRILRHPALHQRLRSIARRAGIMPGESIRVAPHESGESLERAGLTPYAREIHDRLERALRERPMERT